MYNWSRKSAERLATCDTDMIRLFSEILKYWNCTILDGHRDEERQNRYYAEEKSKLMYPFSGHNKYPSVAVDCVPWPIDWDDKRRFNEFRGVVYGVAKELDIKLKKTISWDKPHFELGD